MAADDNPYQSPELPGASAMAAPRARMQWPGALAMALGVLYGPYVAMTLYTQVAVACDHCRATTRWLLPSAPGIVPMLFMRRMLPQSFAEPEKLGMLVSLAMVLASAGALVACRRMGRRVWLALCAVVFLLHAVGAVGLLAAIRA